jgi:aminotransferase
MPELKSRLVATYSFSKKYAMTGWRVGYVYADASLMDHLMKVHDACAICAPAVSQIAALAALTGPQDCVDEIRAGLARRRDLVCDRLDRMARRMGSTFSYVRPRGAYYLMARYHFTDAPSMDVALRLLNEARVISVPGAAFGPAGEGHLRFSFGGAEAEIKEAMDRIEAWLGRL